MSASIDDGKKIASEYKEEIKTKLKKSYQKDIGRHVAVILVGNDPASEVYVGHKKRACSQVGIESKSVELSADITQDQLSEVVESNLNADSSVDGILLQLPLPKHLDSSKAIDLITPDKDVDGLTAFNQGLLV